MKDGYKVSKKKVNNYVPPDDAFAEITYCGNITKLKVVEHKRKRNLIRYKHFNKDYYIDLLTGELIEYKNKNQSDRKRNMNKAFEKLSCLINKNFKSDINELHVIFKYTGIMNDFDKASLDFKRFWEKLKYHYPNLEYIRIIEPHHNGSWHIHTLLKTTEYCFLRIDRNELKEMWGHGDVWVNKIKNNDNIGAYFIAYTNSIDENDKDSASSSKCKIKGERIHFYPHNKKFYSYSKGIKKPVTICLPFSEAIQKLNKDYLVYENAYNIILSQEDTNESNVINTVYRAEYNSKRKKKKS